MIRKLIAAQISNLGPDEVEVVMSTSALARDGHVLVPQGCQLANYRANPIVLWSHSPDHPIGNAENISVGSNQIGARIRFAPTGISHKADEIRGLTKAGIIRAVSVGFDPIDMVPLDPKKPRGGQRITAWELLELSFVSVPADTGAVVTARAAREGKAISSANAAILKQAHDDAERCRAAIAGVVAGAGGAVCGEGDTQTADFERRQRARAALELAHPPMGEDYERRQRHLVAIELSPGAIALREFDLTQRQRDVAALRRRLGL
ncbi:HK97 family phage prohead protease [Novosphingobium sp. FSW06-99]|uniref:HK97 family phage prohead protease n=1 Tax=Novosphingobium sp. FSW06-99 TaxID=1739113 RepID=UPI00076CB47B|nr:HK97 family phage prohead protease [Novosphingobium sp. FSW06-99]KUR73861.1 hypothetical protein AQZ49_19875 [Novosphingobium sp. FSW06-99]